jgi:hypothetical protein
MLLEEYGALFVVLRFLALHSDYNVTNSNVMARQQFGTISRIYILLNPHTSGYSLLSLSPTLAPIATMLSSLLFAKNLQALSFASSILLLDWILDAK